MRLSRWIFWGATVIWMGIIFFLSHQVAAESSDLSAGLTAFLLELLQTVIPQFEIILADFGFFVRKAAHFTAYFVLGILLFAAFGRSRVLGIRRFIYTFVIAMLYAVSDEVHQLFVPGRSGEVRDVLIDSAGAFMGIIVYLLIVKLWLVRRERRARIFT